MQLNKTKTKDLLIKSISEVNNTLGVEMPLNKTSLKKHVQLNQILTFNNPS